MWYMNAPLKLTERQMLIYFYLYKKCDFDNMHSKILSSKYFRFDKASKVSPASFNAILRSLQAKYDVSIEYCNKRDSARLIHDILYYHAREYLKNVSIMKDKYIVNEIA